MLNLKDAYLTVPFHTFQKKYLRFKWEGSIFQFICMAFGLSPVPRLFTKILKVLVASSRMRGIRLVIYLNHILIMNESKEGVRTNLKAALDILETLGFLINWDKSVTVPTRIIEYLRMMVGLEKLSFSLSPTKVQDIKNMLKKALADGEVALRTIASILGNIMWAFPTIPFVQSHYGTMQRFFISELKSVGGGLNGKCALSRAKSDLEWWTLNLEELNGKDFFS
jgi:hypothetical protein